MPKIISLTSLGGTLYVLYDSGFIFASSGEKSWYRVTLPRPYQIEEAIALTNSTPSLPRLSGIADKKSWEGFQSEIRKVSGDLHFCPCGAMMQTFDPIKLRQHWELGHFHSEYSAPLT